jgi:glycosyltransferase involved in cell wall biosynthesis
MMKNVCVSVLLPYRNADHVILRSLDSIKPQLQNNELILVENQVEDSIIVDQFIQRNPELNIRKFKEIVPGIVQALNTGLQQCNGEFIARMDADDEMLPNRLELQAAYLRANPEIDLVAGCVEYAGNIEDSRGFAFYVDQLNEIKTVDEISQLRFIESPFAHPSVMFRKSAIQDQEPYKNGNFPEDYELWLRWLQQGRKMAKIDSMVLRWYDSENRLSRTDFRCSKSSFTWLKIEYLTHWIKTNVQPNKEIIIAGVGKLSRPMIEQLVKNGIIVQGITDLKSRSFLDLPFTPWKEIKPSENTFIVSMVSNRGSWRLIREDLENRGFQIMRDFILCA